MFCVECGTQIEQGKNFCGNCGARVARPAEPENESEGKAGPGVAPVKTPASGGSSGNDPRREQSMPVSSSGENGGTNKLLMVAAGIAILVLGTAGVYFGTDLFQPTAPRTPAPVSEPLAKAAEAPPLPSFEETKHAGGSVADNSPQSPNPQPPTPVERPKLPLETLPGADAPRSRIQGAGETLAGRGNRPPPSTPASRGGAAPGIYETMRTTTVYEDPSASSKVLASIPAGTRVTVVGSNGEWLEVHSRRGNPPGFIRRGDATFVEKSN